MIVLILRNQCFIYRLRRILEGESPRNRFSSIKRLRKAPPQKRPQRTWRLSHTQSPPPHIQQLAHNTLLLCLRLCTRV